MPTLLIASRRHIHINVLCNLVHRFTSSLACLVIRLSIVSVYVEVTILVLILLTNIYCPFALYPRKLSTILVEHVNI